MHTGKEFSARNRLGQKISYLQLYKYCNTIDKQHLDLASLRQQIVDLQEINQDQKQSIDELETTFDLQKERLNQLVLRLKMKLSK